MRWTYLAARILAAVTLLPTGLSKLFGAPQRDQWSAEGWAFITALRDAGPLWELQGITEIAIAVALLTGLFVPLALVPLSVLAASVAAFHLFLDRTLTVAVPAAAVLVVATAYLVWVHRDRYRQLLQPRATPTSTRPTRLTTTSPA